MHTTLTLRMAAAVLVVAATAGIGIGLALRADPAAPATAGLEATDVPRPAPEPAPTSAAPVSDQHEDHGTVEPTAPQAGAVVIQPPAQLTADDRTQAIAAAEAVVGWIDTWTDNGARPPAPREVTAESWPARIPITAPPPAGTTRHPEDIFARIGAAGPSAIYVHTSWRPVDSPSGSAAKDRGPWRSVVVELTRRLDGWQAVNLRAAVPLNAAHQPAVPG